MTSFNKLKWILGIAMIFILIVFTNLIDRSNFVKVRDSMTTIYEDRLLAKDMIYSILKSVQSKELAAVKKEPSFYQTVVSNINNDINAQLTRFEQIKMTNDEVGIFKDLKLNLEKLNDQENKFIQNEYLDNSSLLRNITRIKANLDQLSIIQLKEGNNQLSISKRAVDTVELFTRIEIYILLFLGILIQVIIMYTPKNQA